MARTSSRTADHRSLQRRNRPNRFVIHPHHPTPPNVFPESEKCSPVHFPFSGTFCTLDISIRQLEDNGLIDVKSTVEKIRSQRSYSIQMPDQYVFCHLALLEYALSKSMVDGIDLTGFDGSDSESE